ncbi:MAG: hypothetical protein WCF36_14860 [Candidatus Nanopelagicales bacterium]
MATLTLDRTWQIPAPSTPSPHGSTRRVGFWVVVAARTVTATHTGAIWAR